MKFIVLWNRLIEHFSTQKSIKPTKKTFLVLNGRLNEQEMNCLVLNSRLNEEGKTFLVHKTRLFEQGKTFLVHKSRLIDQIDQNMKYKFV